HRPTSAKNRRPIKLKTGQQLSKSLTTWAILVIGSSKLCMNGWKPAITDPCFKIWSSRPVVRLRAAIRTIPTASLAMALPVDNPTMEAHRRLAAVVAAEEVAVAVVLHLVAVVAPLVLVSPQQARMPLSAAGHPAVAQIKMRQIWWPLSR